MTVKELREKLATMPQDSEVLIFCSNKIRHDGSHIESEIEVVFEDGRTVYLEYRYL